jgi:4-diphosphocytidyl-2-C-methyl-D-erythritol kinase
MRWHRAPAKVNLTLEVVGRRPDGFHELESLVAFADDSDWIGYSPGSRFELTVEGPGAEDTGPINRNLVARAADAMAARIPNLVLGEFRLIKRLPTAAGLGGGSSDAAACIRALVEANGLSHSDERVEAAARETGSDVPVCVSACARVMTGVGERIGAPVRLPFLFAVLVNPRQALATRDVFAALGMERGFQRDAPRAHDSPPSVTLETLLSGRNDLEAPALKVLPVVGEVLDQLKRLSKALLARMSGSGATCYALFDDPRAASEAKSALAAAHPDWWVTTTPLR